jgi:hypothetical protein
MSIAIRWPHSSRRGPPHRNGSSEHGSNRMPASPSIASCEVLAVGPAFSVHLKELTGTCILRMLSLRELELILEIQGFPSPLVDFSAGDLTKPY